MLTTLIAMPILVAIMVNMVAESHQPDAAAEVSQAPETTDSMSLLQSLPVVSRNSMYAEELSILKKDIGASAIETTSASATSAWRTTLHSSLSRFREHMGTRSSVLFGALFLMFAIAACCLTSFVYSFPLRMRREQANAGGNGQSAKDIAAVIEQREKMLSHSDQRAAAAGRAFSRTDSSPAASQPFLRSALGLSPNSGMLGPLASGGLMQAPPDASEQAALGSSPRQSIADSMRQAKPPPLCPTLVMPMSEALLGIQMYELAQLSAEGELTIVGISGKPLLRAEIKKVGNARTLEIAMPEQNSIPRATILPSSLSSSQVNLGSRALEIRGMRGAFYGVLEMRSSGACYVVKDGQTVLTIDGDAESLQLSLKSSVGLQLASVRCSTELFEGVDHVEVRVEPGVDTVLVVAVVLAVLLLSPYLPPVD